MDTSTVPQRKAAIEWNLGRIRAYVTVGKDHENPARDKDHEAVHSMHIVTLYLTDDVPREVLPPVLRKFRPHTLLRIGRGSFTIKQARAELNMWRTGWIKLGHTAFEATHQGHLHVLQSWGY